MSRRQKRKLSRILFSAILFATGFLLPNPVFSLILLAAAYLIAGADVLKEAAFGILHGQVFDENFLMAIATVGAIIIGEYHEAVAVMLFYQLGEFFQQYAVGKSRASIADLMDIRPETAVIEQESELIEVDPEEVQPGDLFVVRPGERIPLDGIVIDGVSALDTSSLTGESLPRDVAAGDPVISGCINQTGLLRIQATKPYCDSTVARILEMVENASDKKSRVESFITRFSRTYTPAVCVAALLLFVIPPLFSLGSWTAWGYRALSFLVVSCPCALVISIPLSFFGGIGGASRHGILMKGSSDLEALAKSETIVLDKTGTLTSGNFQVAEIHPQSMSDDELLHIAALAESNSLHPIARSICSAYTGELETSELTEIREQAGHGICVHWKETLIHAGNEKLMNAIGISVSNKQSAGTVVHVAVNKQYAGFLIVADQIKTHAQSAIAAIKKAGVKKTVMLTGDGSDSANDIAAQCGIDEVHAHLLPDDKVRKVEQLLAEKAPNTTLVFVGDGINDAPVLMRADVGIAMGAMGSDAAIEAADIVLMDDDLRKLAQAIQISRKTLAIARQNIVFALAVKLLVLMLVAVGFAGMWLAVFADVGVSVLAILNAMRALKIQS